jgi:hypothetical protein
MPAELNAPIISRDATPNGGKVDDSTIPSDSGQAPRARRRHGMESNEFWSANQRTKPSGVVLRQGHELMGYTGLRSVGYWHSCLPYVYQ